MGRIVGRTFPQPAQPAGTEFVCAICGKVYKTQEGLEKHMKKEHPDTGTDEPQGE